MLDILFALLFSFWIGFIPLNKIILDYKGMHFPLAEGSHFNFKEALFFLGSSVTVTLIIFYLLKAILVFLIASYFCNNIIALSGSGLALLIAESINNDIYQFRGTGLTIVFSFLMQLPHEGAVLAFYFFALVLFRNQSKTSLFTSIYLVFLSIYAKEMLFATFFAVPSSVIIMINYEFLKIDIARWFSLFRPLKNRM